VLEFEVERCLLRSSRDGGETIAVAVAVETDDDDDAVFVLVGVVAAGVIGGSAADAAAAAAAVADENSDGDGWFGLTPCFKRDSTASTRPCAAKTAIIK